MILQKIELNCAPLKRQQQDALYAASVVRSVTEPLLVRMLGLGDASQVFDWLAGLPFVVKTDRGLQLGPLADELLEELQRRAPEQLDDFRNRALEVYRERLRRARAKGVVDWRVHAGLSVYDALYTIRDCSPVRRLTLTREQRYHVGSAREDDHRRVLRLLRAHEGEASARLCEQWMRSSDAELLIVQEHDNKPVAFALLCRLTKRQASSLNFDPVIQRFFHDTVLRPSEVAAVCRYYMPLEANHGPHRAMADLLSLLVQRLAFASGVAVSAVVHAYPNCTLAELGLPHKIYEPVDVGEVLHQICVHDWRREQPEQWFDRWIRSLAADMPVCPSPSDDEMVVFDRAEFLEAVRTALRMLAQPEKLESHPLTRAPVVLRQGVSPGSPDAGEALYRTILEQIEGLHGPHHHASILRQTYVDGGAKQVAIAHELGMSFGTYRRRLAAATERLAARLWRSELSAA